MNQILEVNTPNEDCECRICGDDLSSEPKMKLKCGHEYHIECIEATFSALQKQKKTNNKICPYCFQVHEYPVGKQNARYKTKVIYTDLMDISNSFKKSKTKSKINSKTHVFI